VGTSTANTAIADAPKRVWAVDFQFDSTTDGRPAKIVSIVDEHTRECLGGLVERFITSDGSLPCLIAGHAEAGTRPMLLDAGLSSSNAVPRAARCVPQEVPRARITGTRRYRQP